VAPCGAFGHALARLRGIAKPPVTVTEPLDSIIIDRDVEVSTRDGTVLRVNVFRSTEGTGTAAQRPRVISWIVASLSSGACLRPHTTKRSLIR